MSYYVENIRFNRRALSQVYGIMCDYEEEDLEKIPENIRNLIKDNRDTDYDFNIDDVEENNANLLEETKKILAYLYTDFLSTQEEREVLKQLENIQYENSIKKYEIDFNKQEEKQQDDITNIEETKEIDNANEFKMIEYKESIFTKIFNSIKRFFAKFKR